MATFEPTNLVPSTRSYSPGEYPQNEFQALNGVKTIIRYGKYRYCILYTSPRPRDS